jgi:GNAT superfamily N-acetyltransferase
MDSCRPATVEDLPTIVVLARALREELGPMRGGTVWLARDARPEPLEPAYRALLDDPDAVVLVGAIDEVVVGLGVLEIERLRGGDRLAVITDLFVESGAREVGVGATILAGLVEAAGERGCRGIDASALPGHRAAKSFFEQHGFVTRSLITHRTLPGPA